MLNVWLIWQELFFLHFINSKLYSSYNKTIFISCGKIIDANNNYEQGKMWVIKEKDLNLDLIYMFACDYCVVVGVSKSLVDKIFSMVKHFQMNDYKFFLAKSGHVDIILLEGRYTQKCWIVYNNLLAKNHWWVVTKQT